MYAPHMQLCVHLRLGFCAGRLGGGAKGARVAIVSGSSRAFRGPPSLNAFLRPARRDMEIMRRIIIVSD